MSGMTVGSAAGVQSTPRASMPLPDAGAKSQPPAPRERVGVYGVEPIALGVAVELAALALELVAPGEELISEAGRV